MIAKIGRSENLYGALAYNNLKVEKENGQILFTNKIIETPSGAYTVSQLTQSFEPYLIANRNTQYHTLHISLNPDPKDKVSDDKYREMAHEYIREIHLSRSLIVSFSSAKEKIVEEINKDGLHQLMRAIRNFASHESPVPISHNNSYSRNENGEPVKKQSISLKDSEQFRTSLYQQIVDKQQKKKKHEHDKLALQYYDSLNGKVIVTELFENYLRFLDEIHRKVLILLLDHHKTVLCDFLEKTQQLRKEQMLFNSEIPINPAQERYLRLLLRKVAEKSGNQMS